MRLRIFMWLGTASLLLAIGDIAIYLFIARSNQRQIDERLQALVVNVSSSISVTSSNSSTISGVTVPNLDSFATQDTYVQILSTDGSGLATSSAGNQGYLTVPSDKATNNCSSGVSYFDTKFHAAPVRVVSSPLFSPMSGGGIGGCTVLGSIQVAAPLDTVRHELALVRDMFLAFGAAESLILAIGIWWIRWFDRRDEWMMSEPTAV